MKKLAAVLLILVLLLSISGCGARQTGSGTADYGTGSGIAPERSAADGSLSAPDAPQSQDPATGFLAGSNQKIIFRGDINLETQRFDETLIKINSQIKVDGAYIESSGISGSKGNEDNLRYAAFVIRVPSNKFESMKKAAKDWGSIISESTSSQDVTKQFVDTTARIKTLKVQEERLLSLLAKAQKLDDIIMLEGRLSEIRLQIESFTGSLAELDSLVDYATLIVNVKEVKEIAVVPQNFSERVLETIKTSLKQFGQILENGVMALIYLLPYIIIIIVLGLVIRRSGLASKLSRSKGRSREEDNFPKV